MKSILWTFLVAFAAISAHPVSAQENRQTPPPAKKQTFDDCMANNVFTYHAGDQLVATTNILPAGTETDFILKVPFDSNATYYVKFAAHYLARIPGGRNDITAAQIPEGSPYVESGLANKTDTLVKVRVPAELGSHWMTANIHVYGCSKESAPIYYGRVPMLVSATPWCMWAVIALVALLYLAAGFSFRTTPPDGNSSGDDASNDNNPELAYLKTVQPLRFLNPVVLTAGSDGKGSLAKLQILFFSVIVFALLSYILLRTGELSDLSQTVLLLLGIAAVGSTAAKGTDLQQNRIPFENWVWLSTKKWLGPGGLSAGNRARWRDIFTSDGEFDVYRYQSCIFSLVVGGALLVVGVNQLASFDIPTTLLGVLGLSQVVYVTGKLVSPTAISDLNTAVKNLRDLETAVQSAANKLDPRPTDVSDPRIQAEVKKYRDAAEVTAEMFASATKLDKPDLTKPGNADPSLK